MLRALWCISLFERHAAARLCAVLMWQQMLCDAQLVPCGTIVILPEVLYLQRGRSERLGNDVQAEVRVAAGNLAESIGSASIRGWHV